jgi:hypothetical protein
MAVIAWFDAVCIALMRETGYTRQQFAVIHPGGAVGERLTHGAQRARPAAPGTRPGDPGSATTSRGGTHG